MRIIPRLNPPLRFYVASRLENAPEVGRLTAKLTAWGWVCTNPELLVDSPREACVAGCRGVLAADLVVLLLPGGAVELGLAIASSGRPRIIAAGLAADFEAFHHTIRCEHVIGGVDEVLAHLEGEDA